ncbi:hypothetical protein [Thomasclavelia cocleata]|uniref:hypothetical protein n=1 Tax=Thomasclavelia cocleata TaxID=69824 RepID=UPI00272ECA4C|nr:hypothetical protein [Thomasclavelia cocleata]
MENLIKEDLESIGIIGEINEIKQVYCSFEPATIEEKKMLFNAVNSTPEYLKDHVNEVIVINHIYAEQVNIVDENSGEIIPIPRIVIIDNNGIGYGCASFGIFNSIKKLIGIMGAPSPNNPYNVKIKQVNIRNKANYSALTFELVE